METVKKYMCILFIILPFSHAYAEGKICDSYSDSEWIIWFSDSLDNNAEVAELRNEYLFCRLESVDSESFIQFLYSVINNKNKDKIQRELQRPLHDDVDIERCKSNAASRACRSRRSGLRHERIPTLCAGKSLCL